MIIGSHVSLIVSLIFREKADRKIDFFLFSFFRNGMIDPPGIRFVACAVKFFLLLIFF